MLFDEVNLKMKEQIRDYIKLLHVPTLVLVAAFQLMMFFFVITPLLAVYGVEPSMCGLDLANLVLATVFILAGGFVVNDYFDLRIDQINRPLTRVVGRTLDKHVAMTLYMVLTIIGVGFTVMLCWHARSFDYALVMLFIAGVLWFYSSSYKRMLFLGNLLVALLMALVPIMVALFQNRFMDLEYRLSPELEFLKSNSLLLTFYFAVIAFAWTFVIEVVKDLSTEKGDRELECHSFPVVYGTTATKYILYVWITLMWVGIGAFIYARPAMQTSASLRFYVCGMLIPALSLYYIIAKAKTVGDYRLLVKYVMAIFAVNIAYCFVLEP